VSYVVWHGTNHLCLRWGSHTLFLFGCIHDNDPETLPYTTVQFIFIQRLVLGSAGASGQGERWQCNYSGTTDSEGSGRGEAPDWRWLTELLLPIQALG
jgi:hypothetical protein